MIQYFADLLFFFIFFIFFFHAEDGIRYLVRSRGLGDVYKRQLVEDAVEIGIGDLRRRGRWPREIRRQLGVALAALRSALFEVGHAVLQDRTVAGNCPPLRPT